ncbi:hypothetical protein TWF694_003258 [Orbilia ellipsospora]|uniref:F-box domain-containing protein n=1 Tax=Orbilia ellipsospora TaxID=2528407 RepID=A0AAV9X2A0_9PEZI
MLLPNFHNLISASFCRATSIPLRDFFEGISLVLTTCLGLQRLELELFDAFPESDVLDNIDGLDRARSRAHLEDLSLYLHHRHLDQPGADPHLWFVEALSKILKKSTTTLKHLQFHYVDDRIKDNQQPEYTKKNDTWWPLPALESCEIDPSPTTLWAFDNFFEINPTKIRHISLSRLFDILPSDDRVLNFLHKFTSLKIAEIGSPPKMEWIEFFMDAKCHFVSLRELRIRDPMDLTPPQTEYVLSPIYYRGRQELILRPQPITRNLLTERFGLLYEHQREKDDEKDILTFFL